MNKLTLCPKKWRENSSIWALWHLFLSLFIYNHTAFTIALESFLVPDSFHMYIFYASSLNLFVIFLILRFSTSQFLHVFLYFQHFEQFSHISLFSTSLQFQTHFPQFMNTLIHDFPHMALSPPHLWISHNYPETPFRNFPKPLQFVHTSLHNLQTYLFLSDSSQFHVFPQFSNTSLYISPLFLHSYSLNLKSLLQLFPDSNFCPRSEKTKLRISRI